MIHNYTGIEERRPTIAQVSHLQRRYTVSVAMANEVRTGLPFSVFRVIQVNVETGFHTIGIDKRVIAALAQHFSQPGVYFSADRRIASRDFAGDDDQLLWSSGSCYCVLGYFGHDLIERRTPGNQGKRYFNRGADAEGRAGNQLVVQLAGKPVCALRGQMPIGFVQTPNLRPAPTPRLTGEYLLGKYIKSVEGLCPGKLAFINLVDAKGWQLELSRRFLTDFIQYQTESGDETRLYLLVRKEAGDTDGLPGGMRSEELDKLGLKAAQYLDPAGQIGVAAIGARAAYIHLDYHATAHKGSDGHLFSFDVFRILQRSLGDFTPRINCVDSLDRTNAVLGHYLQFLGAKGLLRQLWEGGNVVSLQYASSQAMKQDAVLTGRRTTAGKLQDLRTYFKRLYCNNLADGRTADGYRLVQGEYRKSVPFTLNLAKVSWLLLLYLAVSFWALGKVEHPQYTGEKLATIHGLLCVIGFLCVLCFAGDFCVESGRL